MIEELYIRFAALLAAALLIPSITLLVLGATYRTIYFWRFAGGGLFCFFLSSALSALRDIASGTLVIGLVTYLLELVTFCVCNQCAGQCILKNINISILPL